MLLLLEQERIIDEEIKEELERFRIDRDIAAGGGAGGMGDDMDLNNVREADSDDEEVKSPPPIISQQLRQSSLLPFTGGGGDQSN